METTAFKGTPVHTCGHLPHTGSQAPRFTLTRGDLTELRSEELKGRRIVLNIFPSLDTAVCATSVRKFNQLAASLDNTTVVAVSKDLPFAQSRFCTTEGIENLIAASAFRSPEFAREYGVEMVNGPLAGLLARAVVIIDGTGRIIYTELVPEITHEPNYEAALKALK
ncbi:lipid hydroperoxide peroxidase [Barnesiella viscericola DSM 18177]|uniref:Thiol peroxidase n=1 Tax=Barnesiella viscericola DSM 18177 TaxID=880074 RepID=W0ES79_9BACT|nr:thiol peroxidase [Barnesiella viscericola]AHF11976.1 lipid hydroperoxide peroxidase [Barnesiella viscericola DSM 18177]